MGREPVYLNWWYPGSVRDPVSKINVESNWNNIWCQPSYVLTCLCGHTPSSCFLCIMCLSLHLSLSPSGKGSQIGSRLLLEAWKCVLWAMPMSNGHNGQPSMHMAVVEKANWANTRHNSQSEEFPYVPPHLFSLTVCLPLTLSISQPFALPSPQGT